MTVAPYVRSGPTNGRALWHMVNSESPAGLTFCSRHLSGPTAATEAEVLDSPWPWCETCTGRRWTAIDKAVRALRVLAPSLLVESERGEDA